MKNIFLIIVLSILCLPVFSTTDGKITISGFIKDKSTGEDLIGASVFIKEAKAGTVTNVYGFYSASVPKGEYTVIYSYIGFLSVEKKINLTQNITLNVELGENSMMVQEVVVAGERTDQNITENEMSVEKLQVKTIKKIPALMGEVDIIKSIQMLPGVSSAGEGSSGFYVRGGGIDQNLILLDEATVYNASHFGGLFSVFNADAIKNVKLYKGGIPAEYGGRLSSLLDIRMKDGNKKRLSVSGGIGIISSRLTVEGPIIKDKTSFIISGRRTYYDYFLPLAKDSIVKESRLYFYDFNAKINHTINDNNRIFMSGYFGRDVMSVGDMMNIGYGNQTGSARWNHLFSNKLFSNFTFVYSNFDYNLGANVGTTEMDWVSNNQDIGTKGDLSYFLNKNNTIKFGGSVIYHIFHPGNISIGLVDSTGNVTNNELSLHSSFANEYGVFISNEQKIGALISIQYGLRFSAFQNIGTGTIFTYDKTNPQRYVATDTTFYDKGTSYNIYSGLEPRLRIRYQLNETSSLKASYNRMFQYLHLATNSTSSTPLDVWFPSSPNIKPKIADQVALGYFKNFKQNTFETSAEVYYKEMQNVIDFRDHAQLMLNEQLDGEIRVGDAYSYGLEVMAKKKQGKFTGWISYTLSKTMKIIPEINGGKEYPSSYDKPHDISIILSYDISDRINISSNWIYSTGRPITAPTGRFTYQGMIVPVYSDRNSIRMPDYHRLDFACTYYFKKKKRYEQSLNLSVYNVYRRHNPTQITFKPDADNPNRTYAESMYLFDIFPSLTYNFKF